MVGLLFPGRVGRSFGLEARPVPEHPDGTYEISRSVREAGEVAGEEGEEVPARLCTMLCNTGQLDHGSAVGSDEEKERRKSGMGGSHQTQSVSVHAVL